MESVTRSRACCSENSALNVMGRRVNKKLSSGKFVIQVWCEFWF